MGYFPYTQMCIHGHSWGAAANSWNGWSDNGLSSCPVCACERIGRVEGHSFVERLKWDDEPVNYKGICKHSTMIETPNVNRVEVIDHSEGGGGRDYVKWEDKLDVKISLQDGERTLKIFISDKKEDPAPGNV